MKAYYKHAIKTGDTDGYKFNTDVYPYAKDGYDDPYSDYIFSNWRTYDEKGREVRTSAPKFSWGIYGK